MIFQEPMLALAPVNTLGRQIVETILRHEQVMPNEARARALHLFGRVRIPSPERRLDNYPHEMFGGMRQRAMIGLALACRPDVLLIDEPVTALDATVQIQILLLRLLKKLQRDCGLSIIFVTHDIGVAVEIGERSTSKAACGKDSRRKEPLPPSAKCSITELDRRQRRKSRLA